MEKRKPNIYLAVAVILSSTICFDSSDGPLPMFGYEIDSIARLGRHFGRDFFEYNLFHTFITLTLIALQILFIRSLIKFRFSILNLLAFIVTPFLFVYFELYQAEGDEVSYFFQSSDVYYALPFWIISFVFMIHILLLYANERKRISLLVPPNN